MKAALSILLVVVLCFGGFKLWEHWNEVNERRFIDERSASGADIRPNDLPGLPYHLEPRLRDAQQTDAATFKRFIDSAKNYPDVKDPRLAWIELDYVMMITGTQPIEAKKIFWQVKKRTPLNSPIYPRI